MQIIAACITIYAVAGVMINMPHVSGARSYFYSSADSLHRGGVERIGAFCTNSSNSAYRIEPPFLAQPLMPTAESAHPQGHCLHRPAADLAALFEVSR